jgi:mannose-6-phosphate isomerase-like protein (cupin superfamily)
MSRGTVVKAERVMPFSPPGAEDTYESKMLIDFCNSGSERLHISRGVVKAGRGLSGGTHPPPYDEIYYVLGGEAVLSMDGVDYDLEQDTAVFIPAGTHHALRNRSETEDFVILTIWPGTPGPGANEVYDLRKAAWGTSYREKQRGGG